MTNPPPKTLAELRAAARQALIARDMIEDCCSKEWHDAHRAAETAAIAATDEMMRLAKNPATRYGDWRTPMKTAIAILFSLLAACSVSGPDAHDSTTCDGWSSYAGQAIAPTSCESACEMPPLKEENLSAMCTIPRDGQPDTVCDPTDTMTFDGTPGCCHPNTAGGSVRMEFVPCK